MLKGLLCLLIVMPACGSAFGQVDISGEWSSRRQFEEGVEEPIGDYTGLPINDHARARAYTWMPSLLTVPEHQCKPHGGDRIDNFSNLRIWKEVDPKTQQLVAYQLHVEWMEQRRTIYMDGRPHPPDYAAHTFMGFSTGQWEGNQLAVKTTHLKEQWLRRNGVPRSEQATLYEYFIRHADYLTWVFILDDPAYLTDPYIRSRQFVFNPQQAPFRPYPCEAVDEIDRPPGVIPHNLPGTNSQLAEFREQHGLPEEVAEGGAETMYPEYRFKVRELISKRNTSK